VDPGLRLGTIGGAVHDTVALAPAVAGVVLPADEEATSGLVVAGMADVTCGDVVEDLESQGAGRQVRADVGELAPPKLGASPFQGEQKKAQTH
jgi:hypothetical protein